MSSGDKRIAYSTYTDTRQAPAMQLQVAEAASLIEIGHTAEFWELVDRYPRAERAKGFLEGVAAASQLGIVGDSPDCSPEGAAAMAADDVD